MTILDIFVGAPQSKYAAIAVFASLLAVSVAILIGRDAMQLSQKFAFVLLIFLASAPGLLLTLFQLTCMVTGSDKGKNWWCGAYSWIVAGLIIVYSILLVTIAVISLASGGKVLDDISRADVEAFTNEEKKKDANAAAAAMFTDAPSKPTPTTLSGFTDAPTPAPQPQKKTDVVGIDASLTSPELMPVGASAPTPAPFPTAAASAPKAQPSYTGGSTVEAFDVKAKEYSEPL